MAWSNSKQFAAFAKCAWDRTQAFDLDTDSFKVSLWQTAVTPDNTVSLANSAYAAGVWTSATNEIYQAGQWAQTGVALTTPTVTLVGNTVATWGAANTASGTAFTTQNSVPTAMATHGCMVYDDTLAGKYGVCYNYFGGPQQTTAGQLTLQWTNGIATNTVT
jgi:hypothetical protein